MAGPASTAAATSVPEHAFRREVAGEAAKKQAEEEKAAKRKLDEENMKRKRSEEELVRRQAKEEAAKKQATEEAVRKKQAEEEAVRKKQAEGSTPSTPPRPTSSRSPRTVRPTQKVDFPMEGRTPLLGNDDTVAYEDECTMQLPVGAYVRAVKDPYLLPADTDGEAHGSDNRGFVSFSGGVDQSASCDPSAFYDDDVVAKALPRILAKLR